MTPERWHQIEEIFHEALELDELERSSFIKDRAGTDIALIGEVEAILSQFEEASSFIDKPLYDSARNNVMAALMDDGDEDPMIGTVLGRYRIEREIGRGGMGAVYEAVRADGEFRRRVAVKIVKRGIDTDFVLRRFRNERQILAALDHPYITRLVDGGTTGDGRPYFVMDLIDGSALYRYCDKEHLSIADRLRLFCDICEAVGYAHEKLIIHRDLKPSNIIVSLDGSPRLLDFGIAKLLDPDLASDTLQPTATALRMMTLDYASPEQVRGEKVTYATDIYSLGVILFELLTGCRPYRIKSRSPHDVARAVCDEEPFLPSEALRGDDGAPPVVSVSPAAITLIENSAGRRESPAQIADLLRGNLDNIVMKALRKEPSERFASVSALREDILRHLKGEAVSVPAYLMPHAPRRMPSTPDGSKLVAVLPLTLMSPAGMENTDEAYLTVGLADAIITRLTSVRKLTVRPTSSITRYNEHQINPFRAGMELGVDFILDGRIRRFGDRLRISLQLLGVHTGNAIWAGQFDENLTDVLELEDAIAEQVAAALIPQLTGEDRQRLAKRGTNDPRAYEAYLKGRYHWNQFTAESLPKAIECFQTAIEIDPNYALAYVGIADFYIWANIYGLVPVKESYRYARAAAERALAIDDQLGEAYATMGLIFNNEYGREAAENALHRAIELSPNYPLAHEWLSAVLIGTGQFARGLEAIHRAEELDPLSLRTKTLVGWTYYVTGDFEAALAKADEIIRIDESFFQGHLRRGYVLCELGRGDEAVAAIEHSMELMPGSTMTQFHYCFALSAAGRTDDARDVLAGMRAEAAGGYVKPIFLAFACVAVGEINEAFEYLNKAVNEMDPWCVWLGTEPKLRGLRGDPRFKDLLIRTRNPIVIADDTSDAVAPHAAKTIIGFNSADTMPASEMPTLAYRPGLFRRHIVKIAAAGIVLVGLIAAYAAGILTISFTPTGPEARPPGNLRSVAVMPFENQTGDTANDFISDGMSESLINRMSDSTDIRTISRSAAFSYRGNKNDPAAIGRELGVDSVVTGSLQLQDGGYKVTAEATNVADGKRLFSMYFVEKPDKVFALQDEMSSRVIETLNLRANGRSPLLRKSYTANNTAFQQYLNAEFHRQKGTPADITTSIELYQNAIELDPKYALAYQGLALAYRAAPDYGSLSPKEAYPRAEEAAKKALAIDPDLSTAHVTLASIEAIYDWNFAGAEAGYKRAIDLGPNNAEAHNSYGNFLVAMGRGDEARIEFQNAQQLDPLSLNIPTSIGWAMYIAGHYDDAITQVRHVIERNPDFPRAYLSLGEILQEQGKYDEAIAAVQKARSLSRDPLADMALGHIYATAGRPDEARKIAVDLEERVRRSEVSPFLPAVVYAGMNEKDKSLYWLERAYQEHSNWLTLIKVGRRLKNLRGDPRFDDLLRRVGFPA